MQKNEGRKLSIVIPVFNEEKTIEELVRRVVEVRLPQDWQKEVIIVDDESTDGTHKFLKNLDPHIKVIYNPQNSGKGAALKLGFAAATGEYLLIQDADFEYNPQDYPKLLAPIMNGKSEVVFGSRLNSLNRVPLNRIYFYGGLLITKIFNLFFRTNFSDIATCYKIFPKRLVDRVVQLPSDDFVFDVIELPHLLSRTTNDIIEVPISYESRGKNNGKKLNWRHGYRCFFRIMSLFFFEKVDQLSRFSRRVYNIVKKWLDTNRNLPIVLVFALFFAVFFYMYFSLGTLSGGDDHYFHFRFAEQMRDNGFFNSFTDFKSIYLTKNTQGHEYFIYYNFLYYLVILPFTFITPLFLAIKLYAVIAAALAFTLLYWCLKQVGVRQPLVWVIVITAITNASHVWRFFLSRPYTLAPSLLLLLIVFLYKKNYIGVFILSFVYLFWHGATFFMPFVVTVIYFIVEYLYREKKDWTILASSLLGSLAAIGLTYIVSHGFFIYIKDNILGPYLDTIVSKKVNISEGSELYPLQFFNFVQTNALIFASFIIAISIDIFSYAAFKSRKAKTSEYFLDLPPSRRHLQGTLFLITLMLLLGTITVSARFNDYFTMFAGLYIALSFDYVMRAVRFEGVSFVLKGFLTGFMIVIAYLFIGNILSIQQKIAFGNHPTEMYQVGSWLNNNTKSGTLIFNTNWSWFPQLYYYSPQNYYLTGLEPRLTYVYNPRLYWLWWHISSDGYVCDKETCEDLKVAQADALKRKESSDKWAKSMGDLIAKTIREEFKTPIIVSSRDHSFLNHILSNNDNFKQELYDSQFGYMIFRLK